MKRYGYLGKRMFKRMRLLGIVVVALLTLSLSQVWAETKFVVLAQRGPEKAVQEWGGLIDYLNAQIGEKFTLVPLSFSEFRDFLTSERSGFFCTNPWFYVRAKVQRGATAILTVKYKGSGNMMGGVLFARRDSGISKIADLRGKVVMVPKLSSVGGWLAPKGVIVEAGLSPERDFKSLMETENESHDAVVLAVRDGKVDAGAVRTNLLETMHREQKIDLKDFTVLHPVEHQDFPEICSTPLYPDWPVATLKDTPPDLVEKVKQTLLSLPPGHPVLERARKMERFVNSLDYGPLETLCKTLKVPPFQTERGN